MNAKPLRSFLPPSTAGGGSWCRSEDKGKELVVEVKEEASEAEGAWTRLGIGIGATGIKQEQKVVEKKRKHNGNDDRRFQSVLTEKQWRELQEQAIIYKYIASGLPVPLGLVVPIWKSVASSVGSVNTVVGFSPQGFDNRNMMDPEPLRCRRTDGKKWRCGKNVVIGQKYCERHMHRGRLRSRKLVEASQITPSDAMILSSSSKNSNATCSASNSSSSQLVTQKENVSHSVPSTSSCILETKSDNMALTVSSFIANKSTGMTMNSSAVTNTTHRIKPGTSLADTNIKSSTVDLIDHPVDDKRQENFRCPVNSENVPDRSRINRNPKNFGSKMSQGLDFSPKSVLPVQGGHYHCSSLCQIDLEVEPWRCKRTDGKKWRCRRAAISNEKYCAMHMHRGAKKPAGSSQPTCLAAAGVSTSTHPRPTKLMAKKTDCTYLSTNLSMSVPASPTSASSTSSDATISDTIYADSEI